MEKEAVWLIAGGSMQHIAAKKIRENGFNLIVSDNNPNAVCRAISDVFFNIDTFDVAAHLLACEEVTKKFKIIAVMTFAADCHYTVSKVAEYLGLSHLDPKISQICRNKSKSREVLQSHGIPQPKYYLAESFDEAQGILEQETIPFVMKSTDNSGSRGFQIIENKDQLTLDKFKYTQKHGTTGSVIIEEYLEADSNQISEASVETLWFEGKMYWINWVDRIFPRDLKFFPGLSELKHIPDWVEIGHINPARHDITVKKNVMNMVQEAGYALGIDQQKSGHILKADIFFSKQGPIILELTPRTSGGWDSSGSSVARGADLAAGALHLARGLPLTIDVWYRYFHFHNVECMAVVLSSIPGRAKDCTGREFTLVSGYDSVNSLIKKAFNNLEKKDYVSI